MSGELKSPHPVIEVRKWDNSGVLGRHLSVLAIRVAYAISGFAHSETSLCYPSLATLVRIVQVHRDTLRRALHEIKELGIPLQRAGRKTGQRASGHAFAGPVQWAILPFDEEVAAALLRRPPRRKRRSGVSDSLPDAHSESSESLLGVAQTVRRVGHDQSLIRRKPKSYRKGKEG